MSLAEFQSHLLVGMGPSLSGQDDRPRVRASVLLFSGHGRLRGRFWRCSCCLRWAALQGAVGWWMVTSGLFERLDVSPVRLAIHLGMAFVILALALVAGAATRLAGRANAIEAGRAALGAVRAHGADLRASDVRRAAGRRRWRAGLCGLADDRRRMDCRRARLRSIRSWRNFTENTRPSICCIARWAMWWRLSAMAAGALACAGAGEGAARGAGAWLLARLALAAGRRSAWRRC